jgi:hypothetical protein
MPVDVRSVASAVFPDPVGCAVNTASTSPGNLVDTYVVEIAGQFPVCHGCHGVNGIGPRPRDRARAYGYVLLLTLLTLRIYVNKYKGFQRLTRIGFRHTVSHIAVTEQNLVDASVSPDVGDINGLASWSAAAPLAGGRLLPSRKPVFGHFLPSFVEVALSDFNDLARRGKRQNRQKTGAPGGLDRLAAPPPRPRLAQLEAVEAPDLAPIERERAARRGGFCLRSAGLGGIRGFRIPWSDVETSRFYNGLAGHGAVIGAFEESLGYQGGFLARARRPRCPIRACPIGTVSRATEPADFRGFQPLEPGVSGGSETLMGRKCNLGLHYDPVVYNPDANPPRRRQAPPAAGARPYSRTEAGFRRIQWPRITTNLIGCGYG